MNETQKMKSNRFEIITRQRHLRLVFVVGRDYDSAKLLELFSRNQNLWGGRYNPIVPYDNDCISYEWSNLLCHYDPDYIYCTPGVSLEYVIKLCNNLKLNPIEIRVLTDRLDNLVGLNSAYLFSLLNYNPIFVTILNYDKLNNPLKQYFSLNHGIDNKSLAPYIPIDKFGYKPISPENINGLYFHIFHENIGNRNLLSKINLNTTILRPAGLREPYLQFIIAKDYNSFDDFIYFWNRNLFVKNNHLVDQFIITLEQMELLLAEPYFAPFLDKRLYAPENRIEILSFSLQKDQLEEIKNRLTSASRQKVYVVKEIESFPFKILDGHGLNSHEIGEKFSIEVGFDDEHLLSLPKLSFRDKFTTIEDHWAIDIVIRINERRTTLKFPTTAAPNFGVCRIDQGRDISVVLNGRDDRLIVKVPTDYDIIGQLMTMPRIINKRTERSLWEIGYSDCSYRLREFLNLFGGSFYAVREFFNDKFWSDLFHELSANSRIEGDCFTMSELSERCLNIMELEKFEIVARADGRQNRKNLIMGLTDIVQELCENKILLLGFIIKCRHCSSKIWYSIEEVANQIICKGCSNVNYFKAETSISYKLNSLIKNNIHARDKDGIIRPDGNLTVIKTLNYFSERASQHFSYLPQLSFFELPHAEKPFTDIDLACVVDGRLHLGECKHNSTEFKSDSYQCLDMLLKVASEVRPEFLVLSCTVDDSNRLEKSKQYLEGKVFDWPGKPEILAHKVYTPDRYQFDWNKYWRY